MRESGGYSVEKSISVMLVEGRGGREGLREEFEEREEGGGGGGGGGGEEEEEGGEGGGEEKEENMKS